MTLEIFAFFCLFGALILLIILSVIDLKIGLLPNVYNGALAFLGIVFHGLTSFAWLPLEDILLGALVGGGMLYFVRLAANHYYHKDALGLGDIKLLAAAGIWLGPQGVLMAITLGAMAGLVHGIGVIAFQRLRGNDTGELSQFSIPAGPGFAIGIVCAGGYQYMPFTKIVMNGVF